jgi:hypothetical protein
MTFSAKKSDSDPREEVMERFQVFKDKLGQVKVK